MSNQTTNNDPGRIVAILSYITLLGLIIAFILHGDEKNKSQLGAFHLRQAVGIYISFVALGIAQVLFVFIPILGWMINIAITIAIVGLFVFWILGLVTAINGEKKVVPIVGKYYQELLKGLQ
ncbi:MAG: hypothetical protein J5I47_02825 [Vicingus serpentipes]|nr:hypothetical protein [Vicingus serpentipes]